VRYSIGKGGIPDMEQDGEAKRRTLSMWAIRSDIPPGSELIPAPKSRTQQWFCNRTCPIQCVSSYESLPVYLQSPLPFLESSLHPKRQFCSVLHER